MCHVFLEGEILNAGFYLFNLWMRVCVFIIGGSFILVALLGLGLWGEIPHGLLSCALFTFSSMELGWIGWLFGVCPLSWIILPSVLGLDS